MVNAVIVDVVRTASGRGKPGGALSAVHPVDLLATVLQALVRRNDLDPAPVEDVIAGCVSQVGEQSLDVARTAVLAAGLPGSSARPLPRLRRRRRGPLLMLTAPIPAPRLNPLGGAIALGHALGSSGTRLMSTLVDHLEDTGGRYGLQTMCEGGGLANATVIERL